MHRGLILATLSVLAFAACGTDPAGLAELLCDTSNGAEVCASKAEYGQGETVTFVTRNTTAAPIYKDGCSTKLVGVTSRSRPFEEFYDPSLRCGPNPSLDEIVANMVEIAPGATFEESLRLQTFAFQGFWRVNVWILNADGTLAAPSPAFTGVFRVFPAVSS